VAMMVEITEIAAQKVKEVMLSQNKENSFLRLYVAGFG
jgi:iron-sulfur cluster assembly protein